MNRQQLADALLDAWDRELSDIAAELTVIADSELVDDSELCPKVDWTIQVRTEGECFTDLLATALLEQASRLVVGLECGALMVDFKKDGKRWVGRLEVKEVR
jgi:hypothetical protein